MIVMSVKHDSKCTRHIGRGVIPSSTSSRMRGSREKNPSKRTISLVDFEHLNNVNDPFGEFIVLDPRIREEGECVGISHTTAFARMAGGGKR